MATFVEIRDGVRLETRRYGDPTSSRALVVWGHGLCNSMAGEDEDMLWNFAHAETGRTGPGPGDDGTTTGRSRWTRTSFDTRRAGTASPLRPPRPRTAPGTPWAETCSRSRGTADATRRRGLVLGGASMGAASAIHAAVRVARERERAGSSPETIAGLVLVIVPTFHETRRRRRSQILAAAERGFGAFLKSKKPRPIFGTDREDEPPRLVGVREDSFEHVMAASADSDLPPSDVIANALRDVPILALCWDCGDKTHPPSSAAPSRHALAPHADVRVAKTLRDSGLERGGARVRVGARCG